ADGFAWFGVVAAVVVEEERGVDRAGHPVEGDDRQELVLCEAALDIAVAVAPGAELVDNPRCQSGRRVVEAEGEGLRVAALLVGVARGVQKYDHPCKSHPRTRRIEDLQPTPYPDECPVRDARRVFRSARSK